jgi:hypothetical protein
MSGAIIQKTPRAKGITLMSARERAAYANAPVGQRARARSDEVAKPRERSEQSERLSALINADVGDLIRHNGDGARASALTHAEAAGARVPVLFTISPIETSSLGQHFSLGGEPVLQLTIVRTPSGGPD